MIKRLLFSAIGGVAFSALLVAVPGVKAACQGYCADRIVLCAGCELGYAGCTMYYNEHDQLESVDCFYTGACSCEMN